MRSKWKLLLRVLPGNALLAFGVCAFVVPTGLMPGGAAGIKPVLQYFLPKVPLPV